MKRRDYIIAGAAAIGSFIYYLWQACPTFYFWDSAELAAAVAGQGIPHPPGFPLYLITAIVFDKIIPADAARATVLFSVICAALSIGIFYLILVRILKLMDLASAGGRIAAAAATICYAISYSLSAQATRAEVYALNNLIFCLALYIFMGLFSNKLDQRQITLKFVLGMFLIGLGLANHHFTIILLLPAVGYLAFARKAKWKTIVAGSMAMLLPLSLYLVLLGFARNNPQLNWGNPVDFKGLLDVILVKGFSRSPAMLNLGHVLENFGFDLKLIYGQIGPLFAILAIFGSVYVLKIRQRLFYFLILIIAFNLVSTIFNETYYIENLDLHGYLLFALGIILMLAAIGLSSIAAVLLRRVSVPGATLVGLLAVLIPATTNAGSAALNGNRSARILATEIADQCAPNSLLITSSYNTLFITTALQEVYGYRRDLKIVNVYLFNQGWYRRLLAKRFKLNLNSGDLTQSESFYKTLLNEMHDSIEIYIEYDDKSAPLRNYLEPTGLLYKFVTEPVDIAKLGSNGFFDGDIKFFEDYCHPGMDYEEMKSMLWFIFNRARYLDARGHAEMAEIYSVEIEKLAAECADK